MICLGIESTAHTFGVGIVTSTGDILANVVDSFTSQGGGMIPDDVVRHHEHVAEEVLTRAMNHAAVNWKDIDIISYSAGPGIDPILWVGYHIAKRWAEQHGKRLVGVNHCAAHLSIGTMIYRLNDPLYLYVSGVNTQIIVKENGHYAVIGETLDIGLGNMLDKFGRIIRLGFPAGPEIERLATKGSTSNFLTW
jgi:N6-L-threonylcarbamoyladenine synthase